MLTSSGEIGLLDKSNYDRGIVPSADIRYLIMVLTELILFLLSERLRRRSVMEVRNP
jgi:hypothetical protein